MPDISTCGGHTLPGLAIGRKLERSAGDVEDDQIGHVLVVVDGVLDDLVDAFGKVVLSATVSIEDLAIANERICRAAQQAQP